MLPSFYFLVEYETWLYEKKKGGRKPEARSDSCNMTVQAAFRASHCEREWPLQQAAENLHLVCAAVFCDLKALDQKLEDHKYNERI